MTPGDVGQTNMGRTSLARLFSTWNDNGLLLVVDVVRIGRTLNGHIVWASP